MSLEINIEKKLKNMMLKVAFITEDSAGISGILGASGCGKSMTLKCIAGIETPDQGRIVLNGRVLFDSEKHINLKIQERKVGYLFQNYALFPNMKVKDNITVALSGDKVQKQAVVDKYLKMFHIEELAEHYPAQLSGGQAQRVALARIFASEPELLMLDEPFSALDAYLREQLQLELLEVLKNYPGDILMVTHNRDEIYRFCQTMHILDEGKLVASGDTKQIFETPRTVAAARLTGCKNIFAVIRTSDNTLCVPALSDCILEFKNKLPENLTAIGIRAHFLRTPKESEQTNIISGSYREILDDPFEITVILDNGIWWKLPKSVWQEQYHETVPKELVLPEESILFLE